ncbi:hypothetical protein COB72_01845 [bacterium]|nr:MAG: hypothetical protein COB72_01845 [bacterium]
MATMKTPRSMLTIDGAALLGTQETMRFLNVSASTLRRLAEKKEIVRIKIGTLCRYPVDDLAAYIDTLR